MTNYRRATDQGATYFFTVNLRNRKQSLLVDHVDILRNAVRKEKIRRPFIIDAWVVLPDHMHAIWTLPNNDADFSDRWRRIKAEFSTTLPDAEFSSASRQKKGELGIWQRRFWEHLIRNEADYQKHMDYVHFNPVKHRHVTRAKDWPYSSFHVCVRKGYYALDWASACEEDYVPGERR